MPACINFPNWSIANVRSGDAFCYTYTGWDRVTEVRTVTVVEVRNRRVYFRDGGNMVFERRIAEFVGMINTREIWPAMN